MSMSPSTPAWHDAIDAPPTTRHAPSTDWIEGVVVSTDLPPAITRERFREVLRAALRADRERRLDRTEAAVAGSSQAEREALCEWLGGMLHRPPLERPTPAMRAMRALVEALWWDLADRTADPLEPDALSPAILPNHPWGDGAEAAS